MIRKQPAENEFYFFGEYLQLISYLSKPSCVHDNTSNQSCETDTVVLRGGLIIFASVTCELRYASDISLTVSNGEDIGLVGLLLF